MRGWIASAGHKQAGVMAETKREESAGEKRVVAKVLSPRDHRLLYRRKDQLRQEDASDREFHGLMMQTNEEMVGESGRSRASGLAMS